MTDKELIKQEIERRYNCEKFYPFDREANVGAAVLQELLLFIDSISEEPASEVLDKLVISLEETIGTNPHSREVIKEHLQIAAEWGRNHFEDKSETVSEDLEEYYKKGFLPNEWFANSGQITFSEFNFFTAKHFAEWQKRKDQETIELAEDHAMLAGMNKMKEEMMKNAVDATIHEGLSNKYIKEKDKDAFDKALANFEDGDKVKIIIVKTEQQ